MISVSPTKGGAGRRKGKQARRYASINGALESPSVGDLDGEGSGRGRERWRKEWKEWRLE